MKVEKTKARKTGLSVVFLSIALLSQPETLAAAAPPSQLSGEASPQADPSPTLKAWRIALDGKLVNKAIRALTKSGRPPKQVLKPGVRAKVPGSLKFQKITMPPLAKPMPSVRPNPQRPSMHTSGTPSPQMVAKGNRLPPPGGKPVMPGQRPLPAPGTGTTLSHGEQAANAAVSGTLFVGGAAISAQGLAEGE